MSPVELELETKRLRLAPLTDADVAALVRHWGHASVGRYLWSDTAVTYDMVSAVVTTSNEDFRRYGYGIWAIRLEQGSALLGVCGLRRVQNTDCIEILFSLRPRYWGRGYATEAARKVIDYAFRCLAVEHLVASPGLGTPASLGVLRRLGMNIQQTAPCNDTVGHYAVLTRDQYLTARVELDSVHEPAPVHSTSRA